MGAREITITVSCSTKDGAFQVPVKLLRPLTRSIDTDPSSRLLALLCLFLSTLAAAPDAFSTLLLDTVTLAIIVVL